MKGQIPTNVLNGICISVIELQDRVDGKREEQNGRKDEEKPDFWAKSKTFLADSKISLCVAEFVGTAMLLFFGCMGCITEYETMAVPHYMPALTFGLTVMLIIQVFGHISGAHLNPAVTMVTVIFGHLDLVTAAVYLLGQFTGAVMGLATLKLLVPQQYVAQEIHDLATNTTRPRLGLCTTTPHPNVSTTQALVMETIITAVLILVCCAIWDKRNEHKQDSIPLRFGLVIATIAMAAGPFTGASMNTARSFAPAVLNGDWEHQWIYWVGPQLGGIIAYYFYKIMYSLPETKAPSEDGVALNTVTTKDMS